MFDRLVQLIVDSLKLFMFWTVVPSYAGGVILRLGTFHRLATPGFHWVWPFSIETTLLTNVVPETMNVGPQSLTTKDGVSIVIATVVTFGVSDPKVFLLEIEGGNQVVDDSTYGVVSELVLSKTWDELRHTDVANELTKAVRRQAKRYGVDVRSVAVSDLTRSRSLRLMSPHLKHVAM
ncbi:SPFH domain-containing protein [uncultured Paludibaculum sp.]|uniref:SPFH domain-containing protein n=1 Tax=uncultured Paludibaculum sp. TaxID=1765020 RepID=UPI002AAC43CE|nr:SPFH domain-containing protein [uncultured Paludibaculum sp.]